MDEEKRALPASIEAMRTAGATAFYQTADSNGQPGARYFDLGRNAFSDLEARPGVTVLADLKRARGVMKSNSGASLVDLGDGVVCVEFHSKMNTLGEGQLRHDVRGIGGVGSGI